MDDLERDRWNTDYLRLTADDPSGEKRAIWETAFYWGRRQGSLTSRADLQKELKRLILGDD